MKKVSIISPCYNGASYLPHFLQSLSEQTYTNIEFIFVNDGSTDNSEQLFLDYKPRLEQKGWSVIYIKQENAGQAAALNKGLEIFSGDYLLWPDSDDILLPQHIEQKVSFMEAHPEYALAFCQLEEVAENDLDKPLRIIERIPEKEDNLFSDLIHNRNILWPPIGAIIRSSAFLDVLPQRKIYEGKGGQNFQILLPLASKYQAGYIKEVLGKYVVRETSHSRVQMTLYAAKMTCLISGHTPFLNCPHLTIAINFATFFMLMITMNKSNARQLPNRLLQPRLFGYSAAFRFSQSKNARIPRR